MDHKKRKFGLKLLSIVTVCYNAEVYIGDLLQSLDEVKQGFIEHIVIDGLSKDSTVKKLEAFRNNIDVLVSEPDNGIYDAMNKGASLATGKFIWFVNADDRIFVDNFSLLIYFIKNNLDCSGFAGHLRLCDANFRTLGVAKPSRWRVRYLFTTPYKHPAFICDRRVFLDLGGFNSDLKTAADYLFMTRYCRVHDSNTLFLPFVISEFRKVGVTGHTNELTNPHEVRDVLLSVVRYHWAASFLLCCRVFYKTLRNFFKAWFLK